MVALNVSVLGEKKEKRAEAAHSLGKKAGEDDLTFYHTVFQGKIVSAIDPCAYPEKLSSLLQATRLADHSLVIADALTPALGEIIVALDFLKPSLREVVFVTQLDLTPLISETSLADSRVFFDLNEAKNYLLQKESANLEGSPEVIIDHCFEVKGVGTVALGVVTKGGVKVHDSFTALPSEKTVDVKSIQKNDVDSREASCGDRVGLALRGVKAEEIERGTVFSKEKEKLTVAKEFECKITLGKFWRKPFESGAFHLNSGLQFEVARVELLDGIAAIKPRESGKAKITLEKPVVFSNAEIPLLCDLNAKGLRVIGKVEL